jgi:hypothetical protein
MPVFNIAANQKLWEPVTSYYQGKAIRLAAKNTELANQHLEQQIEMMPEQFQMEQRQADIAAQNAELRQLEVTTRIAELRQRMDEKDFERLQDANISAAQADAEGRDPNKAFYAALGGTGEAPEGFTWDRETGKAVAATDDKYQEIWAANEKLTSDAKFIDGLNISEAEKQKLKMAIAVKKGTVTGTTEYDPGADPRTASQLGSDYQQDKGRDDAASEVIELISTAFPEIQELPGTVGFRGKFGLGGAGLITALGQEELGEIFAEYVSGADQETIAAMQTQLQVIRGRIIPIVTGEQGKRLSETERKIASDAVGVIDSVQGPADLSRAYPQVIGALKQLYEQSWVTRYTVASQNEAIPYPFDLSTKEGLVGIFSQFDSAGMDVKGAKRAVARLRTIQGTD